MRQPALSLLSLAMALLVSVTTAACRGDSTTSVKAPSTVAPDTQVQPPRPASPESSVHGLWRGRLNLQSVTGGARAIDDAQVRACVTDAVDGRLGVYLNIQQTERSLTGYLGSADRTAPLVTYVGTTGETQFVVNAKSEGTAGLNFTCATPRQAGLTLVGSTIVADFAADPSPTTLKGTLAHTFQVSYADGPTEEIVTKFTFTMTRFSVEV